MSSRRKIIVGGFLIAGFLLFTLGIFLIGNRRQLFDRSLVLYAEYRELSGL